MLACRITPGVYPGREKIGSVRGDSRTPLLVCTVRRQSFDRIHQSSLRTQSSVVGICVVNAQELSESIGLVPGHE